jgi:AcrR family transcriptional regulator
MSRSGVRAYNSRFRQEQADQTRGLVVEAARELFVAEGFARTTIDGIAKKAGVSPQTVYAAFKSKSGVLSAVIENSAFGDDYAKAAARARNAATSQEHLRSAAKISRIVYDAARNELNLLQGAEHLAPDLAEMSRERERDRLVRLVPVIEFFQASGDLRPGLKPVEAGDLLWGLTGYELYRLLVVERGWRSSRYEANLGDLLIASLLKSDLPPQHVGDA